MPGGGVFFFFFLLVVALAMFGIFYGYKQQKERRAALRRFARKWKLSYTEKDKAWAKRYEPGFKTLRQGGNRYAFNLMRGEYAGRQLAVFDHHFEIKSKDSTAHYRRTMVLVRLDVDLDVIELRPEHWGDKLAGAFGFNDIDFESAEFSRRYHVSAAHKKLAYEVFHPKMIEYLTRKRKDIRLATYGRHMLAWRKRNGQLRMLEIRNLIEEAYEILDLLPRYLEKDRSVP